MAITSFWQAFWALFLAITLAEVAKEIYHRWIKTHVHKGLDFTEEVIENIGDETWRNANTVKKNTRHKNTYSTAMAKDSGTKTPKQENKANAMQD